MREWGEMEMSASAGGFLSASDGYCPTEQLQYYDMLADPLGFPFQDSDLQLLPYSQQQYGGSGSGSGGGGANLPFHHLYASPSSTSPSSSSSSSSFTSTSQPFHPPYPYSPYCLEVPCNLGGAEAQCGAPGQGTGTAVVVPLGRRSRVGLGGKVRVQDELCVVCGDKASGYHYNALTCEGCKGFFRRSVTKKAVYRCKSGGGCEMDMYMRRKCQDCRLRKCRAVGMLAECLLTEVQCQSKRLRKGVKGRGGGQEEEEGADSRRVSSTSRLPGQAQSDGLSQDQKLTLDRLVEAHRQYRAQDGAHCKVFEWQCMDDGVQSNGASSQLQRLHQFARTLPGFELLDFSDQSALLSGCSLEVMFLLSAQQFCHNPASPSPALQSFNVFTHHWLRTLETKENIHSRTSQNSGPGEDLLGPVLNFFHSMLALRVTEAEYALLAATALLCSDRQALRSGGCVERMQELVLDLLSRVCRDQAKGPCGGPRRFGRLLGRLTELRTLCHNHLLLLRQQP